MINYNSNENNLHKWRRIAKRIIQFFRFIKIPVLRVRFLNRINQFTYKELTDYDTNKTHEDLLFLDDIKRYQEVFNTFISFGFVWQDKEFHLAKLKANYIYDYYISTPEAIAKTNIPIDTISFISNRINSSRIFSSLIYLNLFNDAEKFLMEKLLMIYMREDLNCFTIITKKLSIPILNQFTTDEKSKSIRSNIKPQYDEIMIPNWTYSTGLGFVYNPVREKNKKLIKRTIRKTTKDVDSMIKLNHNPSNEINLLNSTLPTSLISIDHSSKPISYNNQQDIKNPNTRRNSSSYGYRSQHLWPQNCRLNIQETDVKQCRCSFSIDYETQTTYIFLEADTYMHHLYNSLGTTLPITRVSLTNAFSGNYHCILYPVVTYPTFALWMKSIAFFYYSAP
ncbi:unnamed protein product [Adineta steineri]|uniref:RGS domain-containing protein n=1 Tax=Adineta steineri TaxID=433720 RepID=A0A815L529_9BILA|nr:unnamed protein product [Adineta steineri]